MVSVDLCISALVVIRLTPNVRRRRLPSTLLCALRSVVDLDPCAHPRAGPANVVDREGNRQAHGRAVHGEIGMRRPKLSIFAGMSVGGV